MVSSVVQSCPTFCDPRNCSTAGFSVHHQLTELAQTHVHWVGDAIQSSYPLWSLQSFPASGSFPIRWPKYCSCSFSISPSNEYLGLISFKIDWLDLLAVQGTLKSLLQHHTSLCSLFGRKAMTNLDSIFKSRDITFPTKVCLVKAMVFPVVMYGCESWTIKKPERRRIDVFELWCWCFWTVELWEGFVYFWIQVLYQICVLQIFSPSQ